MVYGLKDRNLKNLLVFSQKIDDLTIFFIVSLRIEGKRGNNSPSGPRPTPSAKIEHVGVYFAKTGCKIEAGFTDIFGFRVRYFVLDWSGRLGLTFTTGLLIKALQPKEKNG